MTNTDTLMDTAQEMLVAGTPRDEIISKLAADGATNAEAIVSETENHPITKILVKLA